MSDRLSKAIQAVEEMRSAGALTDAPYYQCLLTIAADYLCKEEDTEQALIVLNRLPESYFDDILPAQMEDDENFAALVAEFSFRILQLGIVEADLESANMAAANA